MHESGTALLQHVAERIIVRWLERQGHRDVSRTGHASSYGGRTVDIAYTAQTGSKHVKLKPDPYCGPDAVKSSDRSLAFYRAPSGAYAFEALANAATREAGWMVESAADELFYYFLAIGQTEAEVAALVGEHDEVFFSELRVEHDELVIMPMKATAAWFAKEYERYTPRPVTADGVSAWYRLVPRGDIERAVPGIRKVGSVFTGIAL